MLRSRSLRQPDHWISPSHTLPFSNASPHDDNKTETFNTARRIHIRRGQSYSSRRTCWTVRQAFRIATVSCILVSILLIGLWYAQTSKLPVVLPSSGANRAPNTLGEHPPPILELKRQNPTKSSKTRPMVGRKTLLDLVQEEREHDDLPGAKHDIVNLRWPPLVTAVPEIRPAPEALTSGLTSASVDAQFCRGAPRCRFLFPLWIGEQESRGRMHLMQVVHLAAALNRTLVLPNVGKSRIGGCGKWGFDAYYDVPGFARQVQDAFGGALGGTVSMDDFKTWVDVRPDGPVTQMVFFDERSSAVNGDPSLTTLVVSEDALQVYLDNVPLAYEDTRLKNARCLKNKFEKLDLERRYPISMRLASGDPPGAVAPGSQLVAVLQRDDVMRASVLHDVQDFASLQDVLALDNDLVPHMDAWEDADVLLVHWDLRHLPFTVPVSQALHYSSSIRRLAEKLTKPYEPYVAVHWRMETVPPALLPDCAEALVDTLSILLADPTLSQGVRSVWLATDLPWSGTSDPQPNQVQRSNTFRNVTAQHVEAVEIVKAAFSDDGPLNGWTLTGLAQEIHRVRAEMNANGEELTLEDEDESGLLWEDSGVWGILDKMAAMEATLFVSGARGCGRVSSFTRQIVDFRTGGQGRNIPRNVVELFG